MTTTTFEQFVMNDPAMRKTWEEEVSNFMAGLEELGNHFSGDPTNDVESYEQATELLLRSADSLSSLLNKFSAFTQNGRISEINLADSSNLKGDQKLVAERAKCEKMLEELAKPLRLEFDNLPWLAENSVVVFLVSSTPKRNGPRPRRMKLLRRQRLCTTVLIFINSPHRNTIWQRRIGEGRE